ncbi:hypothetical protein [Nocardioides pelophilus]|uniref:hypothetical protein n=1 Tax=Nocardioides pelophilus TaxID=2172019 RepID=UPI001C81EB4C|nr:hypothetical protein [Nocardioides pelophilus]
MKKTRTAIGAVGLAALLTLTACGGEDSDGGADTATDTATDAAAAPSGAPGFDAEQLEEIQQCLEAAGLEDQLPSGQPTDLPTDLPSDLPTDLPSDLPSDFGSGGPGGGAFQDPEVQEALEACGIDLPQPPDQG